MKSNKDNKENKSKDKAAGKVDKKIEKLQQQIEKLEQEKAETVDKLQRISADYANFQKRIPKQIADSVAYEKKSIMRSLLPSLDNFGHALDGIDSADESVKSVLEGVKLVFDHMLDAIKAHGVEVIEATGKEFDPNFHEAVMQKAEKDQPNNIVLEEFQKGYAINGQALRPSKVVVNKLPIEQPTPTEEDTKTENDSENNNPSEA